MPKAAAAGDRSFEMRLGTFWLVRIGIVMLLTGLVFFGNYAYQNFIGRLGAGGKVCLLYLASGILLGAGAWWQRKTAKESLRNYAQVLFAGGLAAVYFTTYAAHHFEALRVIDRKWVDGMLLLAWAGFMVWVADRKKSEVMALFSILLAYYTAVITNVGLFTLYSNLVLTAAAVFFFVRNRWAVLSFASLAASYGSYGFWRFLHGGEWAWPTPETGLWTGIYFLAGYWVIFTTGVFLSKHEKYSAEQRASFLTLNNGAFFTMFLLTMFQVRQGGFWKFSLVYGAVLLGLAVLARRTLEPLAKNSYLTQGLLLATTGIITHPSLAGLDLSLVLAVESVTLLMAGQMRKNRVLLAGGYIAAALAVGWGMDGMLQNERHGLWRGMGLALLMLWNALWVERGVRSVKTPLLRPQIGYFTVLALAILFVVTHNNTSHQQFPLVVAGEAALFIFSIYLLQVREFSLFGQGYLMLAQAIWIFAAFTGRLPESWGNPTLMLLLTLGVTSWWQKQKVAVVRSEMDPDSQALAMLPLLAKNIVLLAGAYYAVDLAGGWDASNTAHFWLPIWLGVLVLADALLANWQNPLKSGIGLRFQPSYSTVLALGIWLAVTWRHTSDQNFPLVLAAEGMALTLSIYLLRTPEISLFSQGYIVLAHAAWLVHFALGNQTLPPWWNSISLLAITLGLSHWWQKQKILELRSQLGLFWQGLYAVAIIGVLYIWLSTKFDAPHWLVWSGLLGVAMTAYGVFTRAWLLAAFGQTFILVSGAQFVLQLWQGKPQWYFPLAPVAALGLLSFATVKWFERKPDASERVSQPLLQIAMLYRWVGLVMSIWWVCEYIPARERIWLLALLGLWVFLWAGWQRNREALLFSAAYTVTALALFWLPLIETQKVYLPNLLVILILLAQRQLARRLPERYNLDSRVHGAVIIVGGLSLWLFLSRWVLQNASGFYLTASWSALALALFICGIVLRERVYRWLGLGILACALGRVVVFDVWKLETLYRILSFMALGIVLLVLGFIYNKYQEKLKEWL